MKFGWIPPDEQSKETRLFHQKYEEECPEFRIVGSFKVPDQVFIWDCAKAVYGKHLPAFYQQVGSCTGHGMAKALWYLQCVEVVRLKDKEQVIMPYEPYIYAQGRVCAGITGNSDGGTGAGCAQAVKKFGVLRSDLPELPKWTTSKDCITFSGEVDKAWGKKGSPQNLVQIGVKNLVKTTTLVRSVQQAVEGLTNYYPFTIAADWGGLMKPPVVGKTYKIRLNKRADTWAHQQLCNGMLQHPEFGLVFHIDNSWGPDAHGDAPDDSPPGGYWIGEADMNYIIRQGDCHFISQFDGFPSQAEEIEDRLFDLIGRD